MLDKIKIEDIIDIAKKAGEKILEIYNQDYELKFKEDKSPLTLADKEAHNIIQKYLSIYNIPILSEEDKNIPYEERKNWEYFWLIDPLDGTKEFIKKNGEFTVNIALIYKNIPILGVVYVPVLKDVYYAIKNKGAFKVTKNNKIKLPFTQPEIFTIVASKSHLNDETKQFIEKLTSKIKNYKFISKGSSLKLLMIAEGKASIYPRLAPTMEWDTAASDIIVRESGSKIYNYETKLPLVYNKEKLLNPFFVVEGGFYFQKKDRES